MDGYSTSYGLRDALVKSLDQTLTVFLFTNAVTPSVLTVAADLTVAAGGGYANKSVTLSDWSIAAYDSHAPQTSWNALRTCAWSFSGPLSGNPSVYGYGIKNQAGYLMQSHRFDSPVTPSADATPITVVITINQS